MTNHVHLLCQVSDTLLASIIQNLAFRYTRWINWRQNRVRTVVGSGFFKTESDFAPCQTPLWRDYLHGYPYGIPATAYVVAEERR
ncbi:transposase [Geomonas oryzae]|uniref:transposase n=1 Tax=Geomonas oryzae TaxID=2364273 RepID=UPI0038B2C37E